MEQVQAPDRVKVITVKVNNRPVEFDTHTATGGVIKATAIKQSVPIQQDFQLFEVRHGAPLKPITDEDVVNLNDKEEFRATAPDDNS